MVLEDIKKWRNYQYVNMESMKTIHNIDWLIAEVEKYQTLNSQQVDPYAQGQEETARRCAEIADDYLDGSEVGEAIRNEFNIPAV